MLNACVLSHVLYMSFACLLSKESNKQKNCKFPSFAECQHSAKKSLPSARGVALGKARKKCCKKQPLPQFCRVPQPGTRQRGQFCRVPDGTTRQRLFLKRFFFKKKLFLCRVLSPGSRQKFKFCRVPVPRHSAKPTSNVDDSYFFAECGLGTQQRLCRVSIFGTRQRNFCR